MPPYKLSAMLQKELEDVIRVAVKDTFRELFGVETLECHSAGDVNTDSALFCKVDLYQENTKACLCFGFDRDLIHSLVVKLYPPEVLSDNQAYDDTACEIANIVCCSVKACLNRNGYDLTMDIPYSYVAGSKEELDEMTHILFSHKDKDFCVDFFMGNQMPGAQA
ncbi:MAG: hypothetical protein KC496_22935 [Anaerolineae bacterium]|nr:hypothetical protein [Anaerolineae bacterium]